MMYAAPAQRQAADQSAGEAAAPRDRDEREDSPGAGFRGAKRRQVKKACAHCRKGHRCCEEQRPCKRCKRKGLPCDDGEPQKPRFKLYQTDPPPSALVQAQARGMYRPQIAVPPYGVPDMMAFHMMNQAQHAHPRYNPTGDSDISLTDTVGMAFKPLQVDPRSMPSAAPAASFSGSPFQWTSAHPSVAIPTPLSLAASTELHHSLVQSINNLRNSVPTSESGRNPAELTASFPRTSFPDMPPGVPAQSQGNPDSAFDVLRNSFFSLRESLAHNAPAAPPPTSAVPKEALRLPNPLLHTAALVQAPSPASLPALYQRITSLTTSAPPAFLAPPLPLRFGPPAAANGFPAGPPLPAAAPTAPSTPSRAPPPPQHAPPQSPHQGSGAHTHASQPSPSQPVAKGETLRNSVPGGSGTLVDSASL